jgi:hypothetical protein
MKATFYGMNACAAEIDFMNAMDRKSCSANFTKAGFRARASIHPAKTRL